MSKKRRASSGHPSAPQPAGLDALRGLIQAGRAGECLAEADGMIRQLGRRPELLHIIGWSLLVLGRNRDALPFLEEALAGLPKDARLWAQRGLVLGRLGQHAAAAESHRRALQLAPRDANFMVEMGTQMAAAYRYREAAEWLGRATEIAPANLQAHLRLARLEERRGHPGSARNLLDSALRIAPDDPEVVQADAAMLAAEGDFAGAEARLARLLAASPGHVPAMSQLVGLRRMSEADQPLLMRMRRALDNAKNVAERIDLGFAIGKFCDDLGKYREAFASYADANALKRSIAPPYDREASTRTVDLLTASHTGTVVGGNWPGASDSPRPVLIVGMPRSGTSLIEQILAAHPLVHGAGEQNFWGEALDRHRRRVFLADYDQPTIAAIAGEGLAFLDSLSVDAARVTDKMPANFRFLGPVHVAFPKARIIHARRHPFDTCLSIFFQNFGLQHAYATDLGDLCHYHREYQRIMAHWRGVLPAETVLDVPYEDLVERPADWARRMVEFIGLPWDEACLAPHTNDRSVGTASKWQVRQPIYRSSLARWRNYAEFLGPLRELAPDDMT